jgi:hypothetical protein
MPTDDHSLWQRVLNMKRSVGAFVWVLSTRRIFKPWAEEISSWPVYPLDNSLIEPFLLERFYADDGLILEFYRIEEGQFDPWDDSKPSVTADPWSVMKV